MTMNYYLAWLHFDSRGRMSTRLPDGHRVLHVLHNSGSNRHPPALWVLVEAVVATPSYTPPAGFPSSEEVPVEYRTPTQPPSQSMPMSAVPAPVPTRDYRGDTGEFTYRESDYREQDYREHTDAGQNGRTRYPELSPEARDDDYRQNYVPGIPMSPASRG
jgi:hypothetical protein